MNGNVFLDTNVLVYANDTAEPGKQQAARTLLKEVLQAENGVISVHQEVELLHLMTIVDLDSALFFDAIRLQQLHQISYWDAQIIAAADTAGCTVLYSEDLNAGQKYSNVTVVNPFMEC